MKWRAKHNPMSRTWFVFHGDGKSFCVGRNEALARQIVADHNRAEELAQATFDGKTCTYCHGVGACPRCWGRAALNNRAEASEEIPQRSTPGVNVAKALDRLRFEVNKAQKNALIDDAIEQVRKDAEAFETMREVLKDFLNISYSTEDENYSEVREALDKAQAALTLAKGA